MAKIKIVDLPKDKKVSKEEMKNVFGGQYVIANLAPTTSFITRPTYVTRGFTSFVPSSGGYAASGCGCMGMSQDPAECMMLPR